LRFLTKQACALITCATNRTVAIDPTATMLFVGNFGAV
jgi:hypothetical protein